MHSLHFVYKVTKTTHLSHRPCFVYIYNTLDGANGHLLGVLNVSMRLYK